MLEHLQKDKIKLCYKLQKFATVNYTVRILKKKKKKDRNEAGQKKLNSILKKVKLCICHEAQCVSSKAGCSAPAFSGGYRRERKSRGKSREMTN